MSALVKKFLPILLVAASSGPAQSNEGIKAVGSAHQDKASSSAEVPSWRDVVVTREVFVAADIRPVFDFVAAEDVLPKVLTGYGLVPGVVSTSDVSGPWDTPGSHRTVHLAGGSAAHEQVTDYQRPGYFAYRVSDPTFSLKYLIDHARGQWWFTPTKGGTIVKWTYTFRAKGAISRFPLSIFAGTQWGGYMNVCLKNVREHFEKN